VKLRNHNLDIVPIGELIAGDAHRSHFTMMAKVGESFIGEFVNKGDCRLFGSGRCLGCNIGVVVLECELLAYLIGGDLSMRSVAKRLIGALFAIAEVGVAAFFGGEGLGCEASAFVGSVAEWLVR